MWIYEYRYLYMWCHKRNSICSLKLHESFILYLSFFLLFRNNDAAVGCVWLRNRRSWGFEALKSAPNPLSANPTKWSNTLKQFVGSCLSVFCGISAQRVVVREGDLNRRGCQSNLINLIITIIKKEFFSNLKSKTQNILLKILLIL